MPWRTSLTPSCTATTSSPPTRSPLVTPSQLFTNKRSFPKDITYQSDRSLVAEDSYDFHTSIGSLARIFRPSIESFSHTKDGYLSHDSIKTDQLRQKLLMGGAKTLIGISWKTASPLTKSHERNIVLSDLAQVLNSSETQLVCLQYGEVSEEIDALKTE